MDDGDGSLWCRVGGVVVTAALPELLCKDDWGWVFRFPFFSHLNCFGLRWMDGGYVLSGFQLRSIVLFLFFTVIEVCG